MKEEAKKDWRVISVRTRDDDHQQVRTRQVTLALSPSLTAAAESSDIGRCGALYQADAAATGPNVGGEHQEALQPLSSVSSPIVHLPGSALEGCTCLRLELGRLKSTWRAASYQPGPPSPMTRSATTGPHTRCAVQKLSAIIGPRERSSRRVRSMVLSTDERLERVPGRPMEAQTPLRPNVQLPASASRPCADATTTPARPVVGGVGAAH